MNHLLRNSQFINRIKSFINKKSSDNIIDINDIPEFMLYIAESVNSIYKDNLILDEVLEEITYILLHEFSIIPLEDEETILNQISTINKLIQLVKYQELNKKKCFKFN